MHAASLLAPIVCVLFATLARAKTVDYFTWNETRFDIHTREIGPNPDRYSNSFTIDYNTDQRWYTSQLVRVSASAPVTHG